MKKMKVISATLFVLGIGMIAVAVLLQGNLSLQKESQNTVYAYDQIDIRNMSSSKREVINVKTEQEQIKEVKMEEVPQVEPTPTPIPRVEVYEGLTIEELSAKLDRNLGSTIAGKGNLIATYSLQIGVDPYIATAIILHETGCKWNCSNLVRSCNNVGGQKGAPGCGGGSYKSYPTLDEGIIGYLNNLQRNYYAYGLTTVETIGPRYAQSTTWVSKINTYVASVRAS